MPKAIFSLESQDDLKDIKSYITEEFHNPRAAVNVVAKITKHIRVLTRFPEIGMPLGFLMETESDYRMLVCGNYNVFYRVENETAHIDRILYGKRDYAKILQLEEKDESEEGEELTIC
jgi:plasmid stabilization system protein ParE